MAQRIYTRLEEQMRTPPSVDAPSSAALPDRLSYQEILKMGGTFVDPPSPATLPDRLSYQEILRRGGRFQETPAELEEIRAQQAAKYPTPQEMGFPVGTSPEEAKFGTPSEVGRLLGRELEPTEIFSQLEQRKQRLGPERELGFLEGLGVDLERPIRGTLSNIWEGIKTAPSLLQGPANIAFSGITFDPERAQRGVEQTAATGQSLGTLIASGTRDLYGELTGDPVEQARAEGQATGLLSDLLLGSRVARGVPKGTRAAIEDPRNLIADISRRRRIAESQRAQGQQRISKSLLSGQNASLQDKALALSISDELMRRGEWARTGNAFDAQILGKVESFGERVRELERSIPENATTVGGRQPIIKVIDDAIEELKGNTLVNTGEQVAALVAARNRVMTGLDAYPSVRDMITQRRFLDNDIADKGGYKILQTSSVRAEVEANRLIAHALRQEIGRAFPDLAAANRDYTLYRRAADIIERRELAGTGQDMMMLAMGRITDDLVATYLGYQIAGQPGAMALGALNLQRNLPGPQSMWAQLNERLANMLDPRPVDPTVLPVRPDPRPLLLPERAGSPYVTPEPPGIMSPDYIPEWERLPYNE